jgi:hypothetical protein
LNVNRSGGGKIKGGKKISKQATKQRLKER